MFGLMTEEDKKFIENSTVCELRHRILTDPGFTTRVNKSGGLKGNWKNWVLGLFDNYYASLYYGVPISFLKSLVYGISIKVKLYEWPLVKWYRDLGVDLRILKTLIYDRKEERFIYRNEFNDHLEKELKPILEFIEVVNKTGEGQPVILPPEEPIDLY
jgi:hypothetical protein